MRICQNCNEEYKPSSRHKICPKCRGRLNKVKCKCGKLKHRQSPICIDCSVKIRAEIGYEMPRGENSFNWKGGRIKNNNNGYVRLRAPEGHPKASKRGHYLAEHILVMEVKLGRYLLPRENVHHINGVKDDNRIENLELWTKSPMSGIRVADAIKWATEIIKRYPNIKLDVSPSINKKILEVYDCNFIKKQN